MIELFDDLSEDIIGVMPFDDLSEDIIGVMSFNKTISIAGNVYENITETPIDTVISVSACMMVDNTNFIVGGKATSTAEGTFKRKFVD